MTNPIVMARQADDHGRVYTMHYYWCPGCDSLHGVSINPGKNTKGAGWDFTGTLESPTYSPSELTTWTTGEEKTLHRCHTFIKEGMIQFLDDCTHALKGQTVPLPPLPDWFVEEDDD